MGNSIDIESRKQISFDLKQDLLKEYYPNPKLSKSQGHHKNAYKDIKKFFKKEGWEHRQGSVYASKQAMTHLSVLRMVDKLAQQMPWLHKCIEVNGIDITDIGDNYSLYKDLQNSTISVESFEEPELGLGKEIENKKTLSDIMDEIRSKQPVDVPDVADKIPPLGRGGGSFER